MTTTAVPNPDEYLNRATGGSNAEEYTFGARMESAEARMESEASQIYAASLSYAASSAKFARRQSLWDLWYYLITAGAIGLFVTVAGIVLFLTQYILPLLIESWFPSVPEYNRMEWRLSVLLLAVSVSTGWSVTRRWGRRPQEPDDVPGRHSRPHGRPRRRPLRNRD